MPRRTKLFKKRKNVGRPKCTTRANNATPVPSSSTSCPDPEERKQSSSKIKLTPQQVKYDEFNSDEEYQFTNEIICMSLLQSALSQFVVCRECGGSVLLIAKRHIGLASELQFSCEVCDAKLCFSNTNSVSNYNGEKNQTFHDVNIRLVYGLRTIGKGKRPGDILCGILNLPKPPADFSSYVEFIGSAIEDVCKQSMHEAIEEAVGLCENENNRDITVALDGSWQKRGHTSLIGVVTATSGDTGKVVDVDILYKYCKCKERTKNHHEPSCSANYIGLSGAMEISGAKAIFKRSLPNYNVRYTKYLGDGDSKAYKAVVEDKPYGPDVDIEKLECIGHVQKRMGTRLKNLKSKLQGKKLSDGRPFSGRNRVTDAWILKIQKYYGLAIIRNVGSLEEMKKAVWAVYFHLLSTDESPQHMLCPRGETSWCKYQKAQVLGQTYKHTEHSHLPESVMTEMKPIFRDLANPELLKKCVHGKSQNPNESLNSLIWNRLPKTTFIGIKTLYMGVYEAIASFNKGSIVKCMVLNNLGLQPGLHCISAMQRLDSARVRRAERMVQEAQKKARQDRSIAKRKLEQLFEEEEDPDSPSYGPGMH